MDKRSDPEREEPNNALLANTGVATKEPFSNCGDDAKLVGVRAERKKDANNILMSKWMREASPDLAGVNELLDKKSKDPSYVCDKGPREPPPESTDQNSTHGGEDSKLPTTSFELSPLKSLSMRELEDRISITISNPYSMPCIIKESGERLVIAGNAYKLMNTKVQAVSDAIFDLIQEVLKVERDHVVKENVQWIEKGIMQLSMGWQITLPARYISGGKGDVLHECITVFNEMLFSHAAWDDRIMNEQREGSPKYVAIMAAKKMRSAKSGVQLPANCKLESPAFGNTVDLGGLIGTAPEEQNRKENKTLRGSFRGYHFDERKSFFSPVESKGGKTKVISFTEEKFDRIHALATDEFTECSVDVIMHFIGEQLDHIELVKIKGDTEDMFAGGGQDS